MAGKWERGSRPLVLLLLPLLFSSSVAFGGAHWFPNGVAVVTVLWDFCYVAFISFAMRYPALRVFLEELGVSQLGSRGN